MYKESNDGHASRYSLGISQHFVDHGISITYMMCTVVAAVIDPKRTLCQGGATPKEADTLGTMPLGDPGDCATALAKPGCGSDVRVRSRNCVAAIST